MNLTNYDRWPVHIISDSYDRMCVSTPASVLELKQTFDGRPLFFDSQITGSATATYSTTNRNTELAVTTSGDRAIFQTRRYLNYQVGKAQQVLAGFQFEAHAAGLTQFVGYGDDQNGVFLRLNDDGLAVIFRSGGSTTLTIPRAQWWDKLDGTGASKITLDPTAPQIFCCSFSGSRFQSCRVGLFQQGRWVPLYCGGFANSSVVAPLSPNLPIRWEISTTGPAGILKAGSCTAQSEGGQDIIGASRCAWNDTGKSVASGAIGLLVAIRNRGGQYLRAPVIARDISVLCSTTGPAQWELVLNPTLAGTASWVAPTNSYAEYDISRTTMTAGTGTVIKTGFFSSNTSWIMSELREAIQIGANIAGDTRDEIALVVKNLAASANTFYGSVGWIEQN